MRTIENECLAAERDGGEAAAKLDEFIVLRDELFAGIFVTKEKIRERYDMLCASGNSVEVIKLSGVITKNLEEMNKKFAQMKEVYRKQNKAGTSKTMATLAAASTAAANRILSAEELEARFETMSAIRAQVDECQTLFVKNNSIGVEKVRELTDFLAQMKNRGLEGPAALGGREWKEPSGEDRAVLDRWAEKDKQIDDQIWKVGEVVDRLHVVAEDIHGKAIEQGKIAIDVSRKADEANMEVRQVNDKLKEMILKSGGTNFCCKLLLAIIFVVLIVFNVKLLADVIKKKSQGLITNTGEGGGGGGGDEGSSRSLRGGKIREDFVRSKWT